MRTVFQQGGLNMNLKSYFPTFTRLAQASLRRGGFALMLVLGALVLMTTIAVSFLTSTAAELRAAKAYAQGLQAQRYATLPANLVMAKITAATSEGTANAPVLWASQPGLIRSWSSDGNLQRVTRLYSAADAFTTSFDLASEAAALNGWKGTLTNRDHNALWCDLNSPVTAPGGTRIYPIMAPPSTLDSGSGVVVASGAQRGVFGFQVNPTGPLGWAGGTPSQANNPAPMPVRWLYVLRNGQIVPATGSNVTSAQISGASQDNPPVARIAYWTDDETCKVNINTASEGVFWDRPTGINNEERGEFNANRWGYSMSVPVAEEFQRQAGHPAFTSLSAVFDGILPRPQIGFGNSGAATYTGGTYNNNIVPYYRLSPRMANGGTRGGTVATPSAAAIPLQTERLYADAQELLFPPNRDLSQSLFTPSDLSRFGFFLTAASQSPETNIFDQPRISMWPLMANASLRNAKDKLIARATTWNGQPYFFQRLAPYQGINNPGSSQSQTDDLQPGSRNEQLLLYLKRQLERPTPGFGASFASGKTQETLNRLVVQSFDTVRSLVNMTSRALSPHYTFSPLGPGPNWENFVNQPGTGTVLPIRATAALGGPDIKGHGRFPVIREVGLIFVATRWKDETTLGAAPTFIPSPGSDGLPDDVADSAGNFNGVGDPQTVGMRAILYFLPLMPSPGQPAAAPAYRVQIAGLNNLRITYNASTQNLGFPNADNAVALLRPINSDMSPYPDSGFFAQFTFQNGVWNNQGRTLTHSDGRTSNNNFNEPAARRFPFFGTELTLSPAPPPLPRGLNAEGNYTVPLGGTPGTFRFEGGAIMVRIFPGFGNGGLPEGEAIQSYQIEFPPGDFPIPQIVRPNFTPSENIFSDTTAGRPGDDPRTWKFYCGFDGTDMDGRNFQTRLTSNSPGGTGPGAFSRFIIWRGDTVRAMQWNPDGPSRADAREISGKRNVPAADFAPHPLYGNSDVFQAHGIVARQNGVAGNISDLAVPGFSLNNTTAALVTAVPHSWRRIMGGPQTRGKLRSALNYTDPDNGELIRPYVPARMDGANLEVAPTVNAPGDWSSGIGNIYDGGFLNKADEGFTVGTVNQSDNIYYAANLGQPGLATFITYSPTRQVPSPVLFGSLTLAPWRTLLFCPNPAAGNNHPGFGRPGSGGSGANGLPPFTESAPDHIFLDHFIMPVTEPYAITTPGATDGKINLNFQIAPFAHIERTTALHALFRAMKIPALRNESAPSYKRQSSFTEVPGNPSWRHDLDIEAIIAGMKDRRFSTGSAANSQGFRTASEVTTIFLTPLRNNSNVNGPTGATPLERYNNTASWWADKGLTGDNLRESPYDHLYSRVTTRSNSYTVHWRVQVLEKRAGSNPAGWDEDRDRVVAEYRGSTLIERYIDPNDSRIPDYATSPTAEPLHNYYRWRVVSNTQFNP